MKLHIKEDPIFNIHNPYLYLKKIDSNKQYDIYCDGSFIKVGKKSFCCIGGIILDNKNSETIGEFFAPINLDNQLTKNIIPSFERVAIDTSLLIKEKYNLKVNNIFNDSLSDVSKYAENKNIKWIPREQNIADKVVTYCKNQWKENNLSIIESLKFKNKLLKYNYSKNIFIVSHSIPKSCLYYFFAINEKEEIISHIKFNKHNDFGTLELINKMLTSILKRKVF